MYRDERNPGIRPLNDSQPAKRATEVVNPKSGIIAPLQGAESSSNVIQGWRDLCIDRGHG